MMLFLLIFSFILKVCVRVEPYSVTGYILRLVTLYGSTRVLVATGEVELTLFWPRGDGVQYIS